MLDLKHHYFAMKEEMSILSVSNDQPSFDDYVLRENKNIGNVKVQGSVDTTCSERHSFILHHLNDED